MILITTHDVGNMHDVNNTCNVAAAERKDERRRAARMEGLRCAFSSPADGTPILYSVFIDIFISKVVRRIRFELGSTLLYRIIDAFAPIPLLLYLSDIEDILERTIKPFLLVEFFKL
jgi:hypothetical protein